MFFRRKTEPMDDGEWSRRFWSTREKGNDAWIRGYWDIALKPAHLRIAKTIAGLPVQRVIEPGAHCGPNLRALDRERSFEWLVGIDFSEHVVAAGQRLLAAELRSPHALHFGTAESLPFPDASFDLALSSATMVCIGPERIETALRELARVTRRFIVLAEPFCDGEDKTDQYPNTTYWIRDYRKKLPGFAVLSLEHLPDQDRIGHLDSILVMVRDRFAHGHIRS